MPSAGRDAAIEAELVEPMVANVVCLLEMAPNPKGDLASLTRHEIRETLAVRQNLVPLGLFTPPQSNCPDSGRSALFKVHLYTSSISDATRLPRVIAGHPFPTTPPHFPIIHEGEVQSPRPKGTQRLTPRLALSTIRNVSVRTGPRRALGSYAGTSVANASATVTAKLSLRVGSTNKSASRNAASLSLP